MPRKRIRILVAEDDPAVRAALVGLIQAEAAFELVGEVGGAAEAVEAAAKQQPDVAVIPIGHDHHSHSGIATIPATG